MIPDTHRHLFPALFPSLADLRWGYVNFGEMAPFPIEGQPNPLLDPDHCADWVQRIHTGLDIDCSYGGYMEDRSRLWHGHYMKPGSTWHLGIDYNVPAGTPVCLPMDAIQVSGLTDFDQNGGWGGKIFVKTDKATIIFGHLERLIVGGNPSPILRILDREAKPGDVVGYVADSTKNGGWFPHLHVQFCAQDALHQALTVDGYSHLYAGIDRDFPRPTLATSVKWKYVNNQYQGGEQ